MLVYVMFSFWIQICRKLYFTNLANPKNPNLNLDSTDYGCEIRLLNYAAFFTAVNTTLQPVNWSRTVSQVVYTTRELGASRDFPNFDLHLQ